MSSKKTSNIRQRDNGLWEGRYYIDGKRKSVYGQTKKQVQTKLISKMNEINDGIVIDESTMTVSQWSTQYLASYTGDIKDATMAAYDNYVNNHIIPAIGKIKLKDLTAIHVQRFYRSLTSKGLSPKSVRNIHGVLHEILDKAIKMDMLKRNVSELCELPKNRQKEMHPLSDVQLKQFLDIARETDAKFYPLFFFAFFTGMRECEIVGLTWDCIDFRRGTIRVYRQFCRIDYGPRLGQYDFAPLKNDKERTFTPPPSVMSMLKGIKQNRKIKSMNDRKGFVFTRQDGRQISASTMYHHFKAIVSTMGLDDVRFHDARHTFATLSIQNGVDIKTLSNALGHATASFTLDVYGHVSDRMQQDMADKMQSLISNGGMDGGMMAQ